MTELVRVQGVSRDFRVPGGTLRAVDDVSFEVLEGATLGIVGESGCGKSTLAKVIVGLLEPTAGDVLLGGVSVARSSRAARRRLARFCQMVFQDPYSSLNPRMRVSAILTEPLVIHGLMSRRERAREVGRLLERVGLPSEAGARLPHEFSGGQRQRIGIARALALRPRILVADEPVSALDVSVQAQILNLLADLRDELGLTLLLVSHDLQVVEWMSDEVLVMYLGRAVELGTRQKVFEKPEHPYTRALLAAAPRIDRGAGPRDDDPPLGDVPSALAPPPGCHFHPRCPLRQPACSESAPRLEAVESNHGVACFEARSAGGR